MRPPLPTKHKTVLLAATVVVLLITLFFGLRPKGYDFTNHVRWLEDRPGVHFARFGLLYASLDEQLLQEFTASNGFSIELALQPQRFDAWRFKMIMTVNNGDDQGQFMIGQWKSSIIIMNGNDYSNSENSWRISQEIERNPKKDILLTLTTGTQGTSLYLDSELVWSRRDGAFSLPRSGMATMTLGNDVYGRHPWQGSIYGLALYNYELPASMISSHFEHWSARKELKVSPEDQPSLLYMFNEKKGTTVTEVSQGISPLVFPSAMPFLKRIIFSPLLQYSGSEKSLIKDSAVNFIGFIPLGLLLAASLSSIINCSAHKSIFLSVLICFCLSMGIEFLQSWMPSRVSQSLDILLNSLGAFTGAVASVRVSKQFALLRRRE